MKASVYSRVADFCRGLSVVDGEGWSLRTGSATGALFSDLEQGEESLLWNFYPANLLHPSLTFFLLFEQLALTGNIPAVAFRGYVLAQSLDAFAGNNLGTNPRLNRHLKHLARYQLAHLFAQRPA